MVAFNGKAKKLSTFANTYESWGNMGNIEKQNSSESSNSKKSDPNIANISDCSPASKATLPASNLVSLQTKSTEGNPSKFIGKLAS